MQDAVAEGDTRTISLHHVHTREDLTVTYKRNGRYDRDALKKVDWLLRDWRRNEQVETDPQLLDLIWEVQREVGAKQPIHVICGYRAPQTNTMLRRTRGGVAQFSQHTLGRALDFFIPGVSLEELRNIGLRLQRGGIGFYPSSGSPFVHLDIGSVRHWPTVSRDELVRIFPNGRTVHVPSDGKPLAGYALALADIERRGSSPSSNSLNAARVAGMLGSDDREGEDPPVNLLAKLFGFGNTQEREIEATASITPAPKASPKTVLASATSTKIPPVSPPAAASPPRRASAPLPAAAAASIPADPDFSPPPRVQQLPEQALAYAALPGPELNQAAAPVAIARAPLPPIAAAARVSIPPATSLVPKQAAGQAVVLTAPAPGTERYDDPWLRAAIITPSLRTHMTVAAFGPPDPRALSLFMRKPPSSVMMAFSDEPHGSLVADRFSGQAVVFVETVIFNARTALLR